MKTASVKEIKNELNDSPKDELLAHIFRLLRFKKENKELLSYVLFNSNEESGFVNELKKEIIQLFEQIDSSSVYYSSKSIRKILRLTKKYIRYSGRKESEAALLICFCDCMANLKPTVLRNKAMQNLFDRQISSISKSVNSLHEDLRFDFEEDLNRLATHYTGVM